MPPFFQCGYPYVPFPKEDDHTMPLTGIPEGGIQREKNGECPIAIEKISIISDIYKVKFHIISHYAWISLVYPENTNNRNGFYP